MPSAEVPLYYLDANIIIYAIERPLAQSAAQHALLKALDRGTILACTSELSLAECLVAPIARNSAELIDLYTEFVSNQRPHFQTIPVSRSILLAAADLRAMTRSTLADSIHVATALLIGATRVVTNDKKMRLPPGVAKLTWEELKWPEKEL
jgi:predicted nucleic acid-binding protein